MRTAPVLLALTLATCATLAASGAAAQDLGETAFENSGAGVAQAPFLRGVLLLHSFEYADARDAFREAQEADPAFAMAYWGEAMTHNHPVWMRQDRDAGLDALARLDANASEITPRERDYLQTLDVLFGRGAHDGYDKETRDDRYAVAMEALAENHPDDLDAQAFYALALLGTAHEGRDFATYMRAAAVAEEVFAANPRHPGAAHYLIHAYDDPVHAPLGLRAARVYADVAPAASHALHMPSHITLALGLWRDVRDSNRDSYHAARDASARRGEALNGHGWHALWWWHYAAAQLADRPLADSLLALANATHASGATERSVAHVVRVRAQHAAAFDAWDALGTAPDGMGLSTAAIDAHARGLAALAEGELDAAAQIHDALLDRITDAEAVPWQVRAASRSLGGHVFLARGDAERALALHREAAAIETAAPLTFGPPAPTVPANEALGHALLATGDTGAAAAAFEAVLARSPNRREAVAALNFARAEGMDTDENARGR